MQAQYWTSQTVVQAKHVNYFSDYYYNLPIKHKDGCKKFNTHYSIWNMFAGSKLNLKGRSN